MKRAGKMAVRIIGRLVILIFAFAIGVFLPALLISLESPPPSQPQPSPTRSDTPSGSHNEQAASFQVAEVRPPNEDDSPCWFDSAAEWENFPPLVISPERVLIVAGCTLYMMDSGGRIIWQSSGWPPFTDQPIVDSTGTIYFTTFDLTHVALNVETGDIINNICATCCGRGVFSQIENYIDDQHFIVVDMSGYDSHDSGSTYRSTNLLEAFRDTKPLWRVDFPRDAELKVENGRIYAVSRRANGVEITEIHPPNNSQRQEDER